MCGEDGKVEEAEDANKEVKQKFEEKPVCYGGHGDEKPCDEKQKQKSKPVGDGGHGEEKLCDEK